MIISSSISVTVDVHNCYDCPWRGQDCDGDSYCSHPESVNSAFRDNSKTLTTSCPLVIEHNSKQD